MTIEVPGFMQDDSVTYSARLFRRFITQSLWDEGVYGLSSFVVQQRGAGANFSIDVTAGRAIVDGDDETNQGAYEVESTAVENVAVTSAPGANSRYDLVVLQINDPQSGGPAGFDAEVAVIAGTPAGVPVVPDLPDTAIPLAVIGPITTATTSITDAIIADARYLRGRKDVPGATMDYSGLTSHRINGWLPRDGATYNTADYPDLAAALGAVGSTFTVPDARGRGSVCTDQFPGGADANRLANGGLTSRTTGGAGGAATVTVSIAQMPAHNHGGATGNNSVGHTHTYSGTTSTTDTSHGHSDTFAIGNYAGGTTGTASAGNRDILQHLDSYTNAQLGFHNTGAGTEVAVAYASGSHSHSVPSHGHTLTGGVVAASQSHNHNYSGTTSGVSANHTHSITSQGSGQAHNNMQPTIVVASFIRT